jgi:hypothetical protein
MLALGRTGVRPQNLCKPWFSLTRRCGCPHEGYQVLYLQQFNNPALYSRATVIEDLPNPLLGDTKNLSQRRYRLTFQVTGTDFSVARALGRRAIGDRGLRENQAAIRDSHREGNGEQHLGEWSAP